MYGILYILTMITIQTIGKSYHDGEEVTTVLKNVSLEIQTGERVAIVGPSGSGKSTLLSILSGLDKPTTGSVIIDGIDIATLSEGELAQFRNEKVSIIFQSFELVSFFTAYENVMLPLSIRGKVDTALIDTLFKSVSLSHRKDNLPSALSGGEQQRVAIARALASGSEIIFADEPTGNLDAVTGKKVLELLLETVREHKKTFVIITHDMSIARQMDVIYEIKDGELVTLAKE